MVNKMVSVIVNVIEWDDEHDGDVTFTPPTTKYYPFIMVRSEHDTNQDIEQRAMDLLSEKTGWCIKDCKITIIG